ncbi:hypothetical protein GOP47_0017781 [Adiantum capillus-veneris]|uniref:Uncharacterized protein n=1 Tax=Adiantum capillus-veneris TaxID=13818 RepID=A0A9D4Z9I4_ADICA|nr:hypothetical protein GOP47_0017781 [Adiantum capillus-veneris]
MLLYASLIPGLFLVCFDAACELAERIAFFAVGANLGTYIVFQFHIFPSDAATLITNWVAAAYVLCVLGGFLADAYWGRFKTILVFLCVYVVGMILLTVGASLSSLRPPPCDIALHPETCLPSSKHDLAFLYAGLYTIALGTGGIKANVSSFGADQFDDNDEKEKKLKSSFFNWFYFAINLGALFAITVLVYIEDQKGFSWGFGIPTVICFLSIVIFLFGIPTYRHKLVSGSALTRFAQVLVASIRQKNAVVPDETMLYEVDDRKSSAILGVRKLRHTDDLKFLDKAAVDMDNHAFRGEVVSPWKLCTVTQVEEFKSIIRILPIWFFTIFISTTFFQISSFFIQQGNTMDRKLSSSFEIPAASLPIFGTINSLILLPLYDYWLVPILRRATGHERGLTALQRIGVGLFVSIFSMVSAALVEVKRRNAAADAGLLDLPSATIPISIFWLAPQYFLAGTSEVFAYVGQLEFFYDEVSDGIRSVSTALFLLSVGVGNWVSVMIVNIIKSATGKTDGWITNNLNRSKLDRFYWVLAALSCVNLLAFMFCASFYKYKKSNRSVFDESQGSTPVHDIL